MSSRGRRLPRRPLQIVLFQGRSRNVDARERRIGIDGVAPDSPPPSGGHPRGCSTPHQKSVAVGLSPRCDTQQSCCRRWLYGQSRDNGVSRRLCPDRTGSIQSGALSRRHQQYRRVSRHCPRTGVVEAKRQQHPHLQRQQDSPEMGARRQMPHHARPHIPQRRAARARAEKWLATNTYTNPIIKWETKQWGEIPADFGRKG